MNTTAITVQGLGKRYRIGAAAVKASSKSQALKNLLLAPFAYLRESTTDARPDQILWAIRNVSFELGRGEVLGIVGRNGSGKSTLLKVLARITDPSEGEALIHGRVGALLEVGTGFHPELTGRENIFLNGSILGMNKNEVKAKFDQIVQFAEMERFIDTRVKFYSSGMRVRLAFSVASYLDPEVLIVDEVLAVGDVGFQKKCLGKMGSVASEGRTVLLVSHNMEAVLGLCPRSIWLDQGNLMADGNSTEVVRNYVDSCMEQAGDVEKLGGTIWSGDGLIRFTNFSLRDAAGRPLKQATCGDPLTVALDFVCQETNTKNVSVWFWVRDYLGQQLLCFWSRLTGQDFERLPEQGTLVCRIPKLTLAPGVYLVDINARVGREKTDKLANAAKLEVVPGDFFKSGATVRQVGQVLCEHSWDFEEAKQLR